MIRIIQIFMKKLDTKTILRWYCRTGRKQVLLLNEIKKRFTHDVYSLRDEDNLINKHYLLQVNKLSCGDEIYLVDHYSIAIHTSMSYVLVKVIKRSKGKVKYDAIVTEVITSDVNDYENVKQVMLPNMFIEFLAYNVHVLESQECKKVFPIKKFGAIN